MSGVEAAGFVLGAIPLVVEFIKSTAVGVESVKLFQSQRFRRKVQDWSTELLTQQTLLLNNIVLVLDTTDALEHDVSTVKQMLEKGQIPPVFYDSDVQKQLRIKLGHNFLPFEQTVLKVQESMLEVKKRLHIDELKNSQAKPSDSQYWKKRREQIKLIFGQKVYNELLADLRTANDNLDKIRQHAIDLDTTNSKNDNYTKPLQRLRLLRQEARELFSALTCARCWTCRCTGGHGLLLHMDASRHAKPVEEPQYTVSLADPATDMFTACDRNLKSFCVRSYKIEPAASNGTIINAITSHKSKVMFADPAKGVKMVVSMQTSQLSQSTVIAEIETLCSILAQYSTACQSIGYLKLTPGAIRRHEVLPAPKSYAGLQTLSLSSKLCSLPSCQQRIGNPAELEVDERLLLAATIVTNVFQLQGNWLDGTADGKNIIVPISTANNDTILVDQLHVMLKDPSSFSGANPSSANPESSMKQVGILLAEILVGKHIEQGGSTQCPGITFDDALTILYRRYGRDTNNIGNVIRECRNWSGPAPQDGFDDRSFSEFAYEKVLWPILEQWRKHKGLSI